MRRREKAGRIIWQRTELSSPLLVIWPARSALKNDPTL
jgi:hypothetical protein